MRLVDLGSIRRRETLHAIAACSEKDGAKSVDQDVQEDIEVPRRLARSLEEDSAVPGLTVPNPMPSAFVSIFQRARPDGGAEVNEQHDSGRGGSIDEAESPA